MKKAQVIVKERLRTGLEQVYERRSGMDFEVEGDVPSSFRSAAKKAFKKAFGDSYRIISCTSPARDKVQLIVSAGAPQPVVQQGWVFRRPPATKPVPKERRPKHGSGVR